MKNEDHAWRAYVARFRKDGLRKITGSAASISIYADNGTDLDVQQATELGAILLLGKPLILIGVPGARIPDGLRRAADVILDDFVLDDPASQDRLRRAIRDLTGAEL